MTKGERPGRGDGPPVLTRSYELDGIQAMVRCFLVAEPHPHYEIVLHGAGQTAIVDVPIREEEILDERVDQALRGFVATIRIRSEADTS